jgi:NTP pyrophosphatase (non-canonical NTP hydrolase)
MDLRSLTNDIEGISETYTSKYNIERTSDWFMLKLQEEVGEVTQAYLMMTQ